MRHDSTDIDKIFIEYTFVLKYYSTDHDGLFYIIRGKENKKIPHIKPIFFAFDFTHGFDLNQFEIIRIRIIRKDAKRITYVTRGGPRIHEYNKCPYK